MNDDNGIHPHLVKVEPTANPNMAADDQNGEPSIGVLRIRPAPAGLPRRDRRAWRALELDRFQRETTQAASAAHSQRSRWAQGFMTNPPRGLGRRGRRAWLTTQREETRQWWDERRASNTDIDVRAVGVLVIALLCGGALLWTTLTSHSTDPTPPADAVPWVSGSPPIAASPSMAEGPIGVAPVANSVLAGQTNREGQRAGSVPVTPTAVPPLAGGWQPAPTGGVTPVQPVPPTPVDPAKVVLQPRVAGPVRLSEMATPVAAVSGWLARICPSGWTDPFGSEIRRGHALMTTAGWASVDPAKDATGQRLWTKMVVPARQSRVCGDITVHLSADTSTAQGVAFVGYTADRVVTSPGQPAVVEHLVGARIVVRQGDGRWLVDRPVVGG